jgi:regulator of protease activity HflC (stomatin/prohibitin superfamily)
MILIVLTIVVIALLCTMVFITRQKTAAVVETFGKFSFVAQPGLNFKMPWPIQNVAGRLNLRIRELGEEVGCKSKDNAFVTVPIRVQYAVIPEHVREAFYELEDPAEQIRSYVVNQVRATAAGKTLEQLFLFKDAFEHDVASTLNATFKTYGFRIVNVLVDDPQPSPEIRHSFDRVISSLREREAARNEAEALRIKMVGAAEAEKEALQLKAIAFAGFRRIIAKGNKEAMEQFIDGTNLTARDALQFFDSINRMDAVREAAAHGGTVVLIEDAKGVRGGEALTAGIAGMLADTKRNGGARDGEGA